MKLRERNRVRHPLFLMFLGVLVAATYVLSLFVARDQALLLGFDLAAGLFVGGSLLRMGPATPDRLRAVAARNDAGRALLLLTAAIASFVVLVVVGLELDRRGSGGAETVVLVVVTLSAAWLFGNMVYALHYAHIFYDPAPEGRDHAGLTFPGTAEPDFADFCYFAFVLGMTFQVSDVEIVSKRIRRVATLHGLLAFAFNIGVLALTVNLVAAAL
jgi:uncharacterized membrane protein